MGSAINKAASGVGAALGNIFVAPVKTIFSTSCEGICTGTWDVMCFIKHLCISSLLKLLFVSVLTYITLLFFYLLFKVGIIQRACRNMCKMAWAACGAYFTAMKEVSCFLWHKIKNTKGVYQHRFEDLEEGYSSSGYDSSYDDYLDHEATTRRRSVRERTKERIHKSLYPVRHGSKGRRIHDHTRGSSSHHHVRLRTREFSVHVKPGGVRGSRPKQLIKRHRMW